MSVAGISTSSAFALFELERGCFFQCRLVDFHGRPAFIEGNGSVFPKPGLRIDRRLCILGSQLGDILGEVLLIKRSIDGRTMPGEEDPLDAQLRELLSHADDDLKQAMIAFLERFQKK